MYSFSPRRTLAHMRTVTSAFQARNLLSRTVRRSRRSQVRLKATSPASSRKSERAEMYTLAAAGLRPVIMSLRAWMPSKMAISSFPSWRGWLLMSERICRANSNLGMRIFSPRSREAKCRLSRSMSMQKGDS